MVTTASRAPSKANSPAPTVKSGKPLIPTWLSSFDGGHFYRSGRDLYGFPGGYALRTFTLREQDSSRLMGDVTRPTRLNATQTTPLGIVTYSRLLKPGESWTLDFKMPLIPTADPAVDRRH